MKFSIIYADPPWSYKDRKRIRKDGKTAKWGIGAANSYNIMSAEEIAALPIHQIAADNSALFLWVTAPLMDIGIEVLKSWGFKYVGKAFCWVKRYPDFWNDEERCIKIGKPFFGVGFYTKSNTEDCLLGIRGQMTPVSNKVSEVVETIHPRYYPTYQHSIKPGIFRSKIVDLFGDLPRIELFARAQSPGWFATGLELDGRDIRDSIELINREAA